MANIKINYKIENKEVDLIKREISDYVFKAIKDNRYKKTSDISDDLLRLASVSVRLSYLTNNKIKYITLYDGLLELNNINTNKVYKLITKIIDKRNIEYNNITSVHVHLSYISALAITD